MYAQIELLNFNPRGYASLWEPVKVCDENQKKKR